MKDKNKERASIKSIVIKEPKQCHLWQLKENLTCDDIRNASLSFGEVKTFTEESHLTRRLLKCNRCEQLYFYEFYETIDWADGKDPQYVTYIPVESEGDAERLATMTVMDLLQFRPRIQKDFPKEAEHPSVTWVM